MDSVLLVVGDFADEQIAFVMRAMRREGLEVTPKRFTLEQFQELVAGIPYVQYDESDLAFDAANIQIHAVSAVHLSGTVAAIVDPAFYVEGLWQSTAGFLLMETSGLNDNRLESNTWTVGVDAIPYRLPARTAFMSLEDAQFVSDFSALR